MFRNHPAPYQQPADEVVPESFDDLPADMAETAGEVVADDVVDSLVASRLEQLAGSSSLAQPDNVLHLNMQQPQEVAAVSLRRAPLRVAKDYR
jgi:predicted Zn-dependent protease with MMP-like domain